MNNWGKYFLGVVALVVVAYLCWYFSSVIAYVLIAAVISFIGKPIIALLGKIEIRGVKLPNGVKAGLTLLILWAVFVFFFVTIIPLVTNEFQHLSNTSAEQIVAKTGVSSDGYRKYAQTLWHHRPAGGCETL